MSLGLMTFSLLPTPTMAALPPRRSEGMTWLRAAALCERGGDPVRAAEALIQAQNFKQAAVLFRKAGRELRAAEALEHPGRVRGLVLVETALRPQLPPDERAAWLGRLERDYQTVLHTAYLEFGRDHIQGETLYRRVAALDPRMVRRWIRLAWTADLSEQAKHLAVPVLTVLADRSWATGETWPAVAEALGYTGVPRMRATRLADCGHFVMLDHPAELAALIQSFAADPEGRQVVAR